MPTLFFGLPGSSGMAVLLSALLTLGISPGARMAGEGLPLVWTFIWALVLANVLSVFFFLSGSRWILRFASIPGRRVFPFVLSLALLGSFLSALCWQALILVFVFGSLGVVLKRYGWPRAPFAIGLVLGTSAEIALHKSLSIWGPTFVLRPVSLLLLALVIVSLSLNFLRRHLPVAPDGTQRSAVSGLMMLIFASSMLTATAYSSQAALLPLCVSGVGLLVGLFDLARSSRGRPALSVPVSPPWWPIAVSPALAWFSVFVLGGTLFGLAPGLPLLTTIYMARQERLGLFSSVISGVILYALFEGLMARVLGMSIFHGVLAAYVQA